MVPTRKPLHIWDEQNWEENTSWTACAEKVLFAGNDDYRVGWIKAQLSDSSWRSFTPPFIWEELTAAGSDIWSGLSGQHVACLHSATSGLSDVVPGSHLIFHLPWWCKTEFQCSYFEKNMLPGIKSGLCFPNTKVSRCLSKCARCRNMTIRLSQVCENRGGGSVMSNMADRQVCPNSHPCCRPHGSNIHCTVPDGVGGRQANGVKIGQHSNTRDTARNPGWQEPHLVIPLLCSSCSGLKEVFLSCFFSLSLIM